MTANPNATRAASMPEIIESIPPMVAIGILALGIVAGVSVMLLMERRRASQS